MKKTTILFAFIFLNSTNLLAQNQFELNEEAYHKYINTDKELNNIYQKVITDLDKTRKNKLRIVEKNWIKFRDTHCNFIASSYEGGSMKPMILHDCLEKETRKRIQDLKDITIY